MIGSPNIYGNENYNTASDEFWATASAERKEKQSRNWQKLAESGATGKEGETIREYLAMAPVYWYNPDYDASWLWEDMTVNEEIIDHIYGIVFKNYRMFRTMNNIPAPVLLVMGKYDYAVPHTLWQGYDSVTGITVKMLEKSGHTPQLEESCKFNEYLLKWISKNIAY
jgi:proline iminopeptidase